MKDQVDGLRECGYPAGALHSGMSLESIRSTEAALARGRLRLVFVAPERLLTPRFHQLIERLPSPAFAIDEAHCISHWGHDFRPEYRQLSELKGRYPGASIHAYTATATERVRTDIIEQLRLVQPETLVGVFDRPNLVYRVTPRVDVRAQTKEILKRHSGEAAIVYCISRKDAEAMAQYLKTQKLRVACYHAGMTAEDRRRTQDAFASEELDVVTATVAFGMGIDRSDVRVVIHTAMPKSVEHYQQETGRSGRDGLEAECVLLYSAADVLRWESLIEKSADEAEAQPHTVTAARGLLEHMRRFSTAVRCRHRALSEYFGQKYPKADCAACDVCLGEIEGMADSTVTAQKILSCVARAGERFGAEHIVDVLLGAETERIRRWNHQKLSTYGLMKEADRKVLTNLLFQLVDAGLLARTEGDRPVLQLNEHSWAVLRGQRQVTLLEPRTRVRKARFDEASWEGVDRGLFDRLRTLRRKLADQRQVPAYVLFSDATLRDLARLRPKDSAAMLRVRGVGELKLADFGPAFLDAIRDYSEANGLPSLLETPVKAVPVPRPKAETPPKLPSAKKTAFEMFERNASVNEVATATARAASTAWGYLGEFIAQNPDHSIDAWVAPELFQAIEAAAREVGMQYQKPIFDKLEGAVPYEQIRMTLARLRRE
jgi:ATP-dependent DNA helicase RecQ